MIDHIHVRSPESIFLGPEKRIFAVNNNKGYLTCSEALHQKERPDMLLRTLQAMPAAHQLSMPTFTVRFFSDM